MRDDVIDTEILRDSIVYRCGSKSMTIGVESGAEEIVVFTETIGRWDDDPGIRVSAAERDAILQDIIQNLKERGYLVKAVPIG